MKVLGYVTNEGVVSREDAQKLTHINCAFGFLRLDGSIDVDHLKICSRLETLRSWNPGLKIVVSVVPKEPDAFTQCADSQELRERVGESCRSIVRDYGFDGVDFDWEYPCVPSNGMNCSPRDRENFTLLCREVRCHLGTGAILSIAGGADLYYTECVELPALSEILDYICLMTYDLKCGFHALAGHHTQLYSSLGDIFMNSCDQALRLFHEAGVPKEKLLLGAAFYSRKWEEIEDRNHGLLQIAKTGGGYGPNYDTLARDYVNKNGFVRYWDEEAQAPWLFDGSTFLSYDDPQSVEAKCRYVLEEGFGGIFYWEHSCDTTGVLLRTISDSLGR